MRIRRRRMLEDPHERDDIGCWALEPRFEPVLDAGKSGFRILRINLLFGSFIRAANRRRYLLLGHPGHS
jgi:hypothetical protein